MLVKCIFTSLFIKKHLSILFITLYYVIQRIVMPENTEEDLFEKYSKEIKKQVEVNEFNLKEIQLGLPAARHYWVSRLMHHKREINKLKKLRKQAKSKISEKIVTDSPVPLSTKAVDMAIDNHQIVQKIDDRLAENEVLIEYLTKIETNFRSISYDISNLIKIIELETT